MWQEFNARGPICHLWRDIYARRITAMTILIALLAIGAVVSATALQLVRLIGSDGYGHRPPPRSHWSEEALSRR